MALCLQACGGSSEIAGAAPNDAAGVGGFADAAGNDATRDEGGGGSGGAGGAGADVASDAADEDATPDVSDGGVEPDAADGAKQPDASNASDASEVGSEAGSDVAVDVGEIDANGWTPAQLPKLGLWLAADMGVATALGKVTTWMDQSGHGNNATQTVGDRQPTLTPTSLNGRPVVRFDGVNNALHVGESPSLQYGTGDYTIEIVAAWQNNPNGLGSPYGILFSKQSQLSPDYTGIGIFANFPLPAPDTTFGTLVRSTNGQDVHTPQNGFNDGVARVLGVRRIGGTTLEVRVNGVSAATKVVEAVNVDTSGTFLFIGAQEKPGSVIQAMRGYIAEMIVVGSSLAPTELANLEAYLKAKYGL
jgi:hypothetical protein